MAAADEFPAGFCVMPFIGMHVDTTGVVAPCCEYVGSLGDAADGLADAWRSDAWDELRRRFAAGEHVEACWKCHDQERDGGRSVRLMRNDQFIGTLPTGAEPAATAAPRLLDLRLSNRCNLKCRTCWHGASSRWFADARALGLPTGEHAEIEPFADGAVLPALEPLLHDLETCYFAGGEPLLAPDHADVLRRMIELGRTDIELEYNSNMMVRDIDGSDVFALWSKFDVVRLEASIDGVDDVGALVRSGFDWAVFAAHVDRFVAEVPSGELRFGVTVSALNVGHVPHLVRTLRSKWTHRPIRVHVVSSPRHYRVDVLPDDQRAALAADYGRLAAEIESVGDDAELAERLRAVGASLERPQAPADVRWRFVDLTRRLDERRGEATADIVPELAVLVNRPKRLRVEARLRRDLRRLTDRRPSPPEHPRRSLPSPSSGDGGPVGDA